MSDQKLKGAVMIIGSLYWDNDPYRLALREKFLDMASAKTVGAPIRYGRFSDKRKTYTMVFSTGLSSDELGKAKLISLKNEYCTTEKIEEANKAIINAEHKKETDLGRYNWGWGCLSVLLNPKLNDQKLADLWDRNFGNGFDPYQYKVGNEKPVVLSNGQLQIPWLEAYNGYDFIIVTATKPEVEKYPSSDKLLETFKKDDEYFIGNYENGIRTFQDGDIIESLMESKGYKETKIGWIPNDWHCKSFGDYADFKNGLNFSKEDRGPGFKIIGVGDFQDHHSITYQGLEEVNPIHEISEGYFLKENDLLFVRSNGNIDLIGRVILLENINYKITHSGFTIRARVDEEKANPVFYSYVFKSFIVKNQYLRLGGGTNISNLSQATLNSIKIVFPPLLEQKAIAQVLSTWDKAIENLTQLITKKQQRKKALMQALLTGKTRFPGFDGEWKEVKLGEYFTERREAKRPHLPLLSIGSSGVYPQTESNKKDTSNADKAKYKRICPDDIGYNTMRMWQGRSALSSLEGIVSPAYTIVTPKKNADALFFSYLFKFPYVVHRFFRNSQGLVDDTLNCKFKDFAIVKVMVPPTKEEQTKIAQVLKNADAEIKVLEQKKEYLQDQKKGLMQQLLTGRKRLKY